MERCGDVRPIIACGAGPAWDVEAGLSLRSHSARGFASGRCRQSLYLHAYDEVRGGKRLSRYLLAPSLNAALQTGRFEHPEKTGMKLGVLRAHGRRTPEFIVFSD